MLNKPIGLLGGTFDPIHLGHLTIAQKILQDLQLQKIEFILNKQSPIRDQPFAKVNDRLNMLKLALSDYSNFSINDCELNRPSPSYTIDTVKMLRHKHPDLIYCLIVGSDSFNYFNQWCQWEKIFEFVHVVVVNRGGVQLFENEPWLKNILHQRQTHHIEELTTQMAGKIFIKKISPLFISASEIRLKINRGEDVSAFLPKAVDDYIKLHHLYK